jgi:hypothetical protein
MTPDGQNTLADVETFEGEMTKKMVAGSIKNAGALKSASFIDVLFVLTDITGKRWIR